MRRRLYDDVIVIVIVVKSVRFFTTDIASIGTLTLKVREHGE